MQRMFQIPELVREVLSHVEVPYSWEPRDTKTAYHKSLGRFARVSRVFHEPALAKLWHELYDLVPLYRLLDGLRLRNGSWTLATPLLPSSIEAIQRYGTRIRILRLGPRTDVLTGVPSPRSIDVAIHFQLTHLLHGKCLFPNLQELYYDLGFPGTKPSISPELLLMVSPSLESVDFALSEFKGDSVTETFLQQLAMGQNNLRRLSLQRTRMMECVAPIIGHFTQLRAVTLRVTDPDYTHLAFEALAQHPHLTTLDVDFSLWDDEPPPEGVDLATLKSGYAALTSLTMLVPPVHATLLLKLFLCPGLNALRLHHNWDDVSTEAETIAWWEKLLSEVPVLFPSLTELSYGYINEDGPGSDWSGRHSTMATIQPLLVLKQLEDLAFYGISGSLSDNDVETISLALPSIAGLDLPCGGKGVRPSFAGLHSFARNCPQLGRLSLSIDTTYNNGTTGFTAPQEELEDLNLTRSYILEEKIFVRQILRVFPRLVSLGDDDADGELGDLLTMCRGVLYDEEERLRKEEEEEERKEGEAKVAAMVK